ncbi:phage tail tape measure protein [Nocardiopsis sp. CNR-923]|nr:phage tail tape measure protein [Nocardiopsis sp. CNR-923]
MATGGGFKIATGWVEIVGRADKAQIRRTVHQVGEEAGRQLGTSYGQSAQRSMAAQQGQTDTQFASAGQRSGAAAASGMREGIAGSREGVAAAAGATGASAGQRFTQQATHHIRNGNTQFTSAGQSAANAAGAGMGPAGDRAGRGFTRGLASGLGGVGAVAAGAAGVAIGALGLIGGSVLTISGDFEQAMNGVRAVTGATGAEFTQLQTLAEDMGSSTAYTATQAANAMEFLGMAGFRTQEVMAALPDVLNLAAAGKTDLARTADIASNVLSGFALEASEMGRVSDVLAHTMRRTNVDLSMLGESMKYAAPLATAAGWSLEETASAVGFLGTPASRGPWPVPASTASWRRCPIRPPPVAAGSRSSVSRR